MKNGFTLIEIIVSITIILVIGTTSVILFNNLNKSINNKQYNKIVNEIELAAEIYVLKNEVYKNDLYSKNIKFTLVGLDILMENGLLKENLLNPLTNKKIDVNTSAKVYLDKDNNIVSLYPGKKEPFISLENKDYTLGCKVSPSVSLLYEGLRVYDEEGKIVDNPNCTFSEINNNNFGIQKIKISCSFIIDEKNIIKSITKPIEITNSEFSNQDIIEILFNEENEVYQISEVSEESIFSGVKGKKSDGTIINLDKSFFKTIDLNNIIENKENNVIYEIKNNCINEIIKKTRKIKIGPKVNPIIKPVDGNTLPLCITNNVNCEYGTKIDIQVSDNETYPFYVLDNKPGILVLIADKNYGEKCQWREYRFTNSLGPTWALTCLGWNTSNWNKIPDLNYLLADDGGYNKYGQKSINGVKSRLPNYKEVYNTGCRINTRGSCPTWLVDNTNRSVSGYWTSAAGHGSTDAVLVSGDGRNELMTDGVQYNTYWGVRPVIEVPRN